ncbi:MAG TPA: type VI secretion system baseplate subunit TssG [Geminicoccaceae bacterium]|nr:type VI secretion system baseplate subunit TssG [Geminicoccus sp.]HMU48672.1 type VI secretion system baseplate subunit TssG [Geminicoccaceae bacterium]
MAGTARATAPSLTPGSADPVAGSDFFAALRLVESAHATLPRLGKAARAHEEPLRLTQEPQLAFPTSSVAAFSPAANGSPAELAVSLIGLFGSGGPLPLHLTTYALERRQQADDAFIDFCGLLQHRLIALFYRAWADGRPHVQHDRPAQDRFRLYLGALAGLGLPAMRDRDVLPDRFKLHHAGLLGYQSSHLERAEVLLRDLLRAPVQLQEFEGGWLDLPERLQTRLGVAGTRLAVDAVVGAASFQRQHLFHIRVGPVDLDAYLALLPGGSRLDRLTALVRLLAGDALEWGLVLVLAAAEVPPLRLDGGARLGWTSWLPAEARTRDADDLVLRPARATAS